MNSTGIRAWYKTFETGDWRLWPYNRHPLLYSEDLRDQDYGVGHIYAYLRSNGVMWEATNDWHVNETTKSIATFLDFSNIPEDKPIPSPAYAFIDQMIGKKNDTGKIDYTLLPWKEVALVVQVLEFGAKKYGADNWTLVPDGRARYERAAFRHLIAYSQGEKNDEESHLPHLAHAICCMLFALYFD